MFLLDTNVVSELRRPRPHGGVVAWLQPIPASRIFLSAVTAGEIQAGVEVTRRQDPAKAQEIEAWLERGISHFAMLPMDMAAFRRWARIMAGKSMALAQDGMIAATALEHGLTVATRNVDDFAAFGVGLVNPFDTPRV